MDKPVAASSTELLLSTRPSPQERLAASRKALVRHMTRDTPPDHRSTAEDHKQPTALSQEPERPYSRSLFSSGTLALLKRGVRTWWRHHPANLAVSVAQPLLGRYASQSPLRLLVISAGVGAALVLAKPWRLISMGGIALATLKSSEFSGLLMSMLSSQPDDNDPSA